MQSTVLENKGCETFEEDEDIFLSIPAYNEELSIGSVLHKSLKVDVVDDILVVDDGSEDETSDIAKEYGVKKGEIPRGKVTKNRRDKDG